jgi:hypothetical protein
MTRDR